MKLAALLLALVGCASSKPAATTTPPVSNPMPPRQAEPPEPVREPPPPTAKTTQPLIPISLLLAQYESFADAVCACADITCVSNEVVARPDFAENMAHVDFSTMTPADNAVLVQHAQRLSDCVSKLSAAPAPTTP
jgi:hypothetical protein